MNRRLAILRLKRLAELLQHLFVRSFLRIVNVLVQDADQLFQVVLQVHSGASLRHFALIRVSFQIEDPCPWSVLCVEAGLQHDERFQVLVTVGVARRRAQQCSATWWQVELDASNSGAGLRCQLLEASDC
eukprot:7173549-Heterocapsa_arctica.AAC.1